MSKLSVITICYNDPDIKKTCESIVNQAYQDFEWIVIDGGSNQETIEVLNRYQDRINVFVNEKDNGIYHAMNKGIRLANGEYLHFLNAGDCYFDEDVVNKVSKLLNGSDIIFGDLKFLQGKKTSIRRYPDEIPYGWLNFDSLPHPASFIKKELFNKYGLYNENHKIVSDWEKWIEFIDINKCTYKHIPIVVSIHNYNGISSVFNELHLREVAEVKTKYYEPSVDELKTKRYIKFLKIPLMKIVKNFDQTTYSLFGVLPLLKINKN